MFQLILLMVTIIIGLINISIYFSQIYFLDNEAEKDNSKMFSLVVVMIFQMIYYFCLIKFIYTAIQKSIF